MSSKSISPLLKSLITISEGIYSSLAIFHFSTSAGDMPSIALTSNIAASLASRGDGLTPKYLAISTLDLPITQTCRLGVISGKIWLLTTTKPTMGKMLQETLRAPVTRLITPICRGLIRVGVSANMVTAVGALFTILAALLTFPNGRFFAGTMFIIFFVLFDLLDGTIARLSPKGSNAWGALLDSTLDRLTDAVIIGSVIWYLIDIDDALVPLVLVTAVLGFLISYIKARSESLGIECNGGFAERSERLIIFLTTTGFAGLGVPHALAVGFWVLAIASLVSVFQRLVIVYKGSH